MTKDIKIDWFKSRLSDPSTRGIARDMAHLIRSGEIPIGTRLPSVRDLAESMGVSPATISGAWSQLRRFKVISGRGRNGIWVTGDQASLRPVRFDNYRNISDRIVADLTLASPDPSLLPALDQALQFGALAKNLNSYDREPITEHLLKAVRARWPYVPEAFLAMNGGIEAVNTVLHTQVMPGTTVAIENPTASRLLDLLDGVGAHVLGVDCDDAGPLPHSLQAALESGATAFIYQPRTSATTGRIVTEWRMEELAKLLAAFKTLVIEDDGLGDLSSAPTASIGKWIPDQTIHIISYSKTLGPDLRLAVLSAPKDVAQQIRAFRNFGASWTSRILQDAVAWLLEDADTQAQVERARVTYRTRRDRLVEGLRQRGIEVVGTEGLSVWIKVPSEQHALVTMALHGYAVFPGSKFFTKSADSYIRVATSKLPEDVESIAMAIEQCMDTE